jgi:hypothetical protein
MVLSPREQQCETHDDVDGGCADSLVRASSVASFVSADEKGIPDYSAGFSNSGISPTSIISP